MPISTQDFLHGLDFTGLSNPVTGLDHNNLIDDATPAGNKSINIWSADTALNTPDVPDPGSFANWARYYWIRKPHSTATDTTPIAYLWNADMVTPDATLLKWVQVTGDLTTIISDISTLQTDVLFAQQTADGAAATATIAVGNAQAANISAGNAAVDASNAASSAATAQAAAKAAQDAVDAATDISNKCSKFSESEALGNASDLYGTSSGTNDRILNTIDNDPTPDFSLNASTGELTCLVAGTYKVEGEAWMVGTGSNYMKHQLLLAKNGAVANSLIGLNGFGFNGAGAYSTVKGYVTLAINDIIKLQSIWETVAGQQAYNGFGLSITREVRCVLILQKLDS